MQNSFQTQAIVDHIATNIPVVLAFVCKRNYCGAVETF